VAGFSQVLLLFVLHKFVVTGLLLKPRFFSVDAMDWCSVLSWWLSCLYRLTLNCPLLAQFSAFVSAPPNRMYQDNPVQYLPYNSTVYAASKPLGFGNCQHSKRNRRVNVSATEQQNLEPWQKLLTSLEPDVRARPVFRSYWPPADAGAGCVGLGIRTNDVESVWQQCPS
jgi:hypothetical protein